MLAWRQKLLALAHLLFILRKIEGAGGLLVEGFVKEGAGVVVSGREEVAVKLLRRCRLGLEVVWLLTELSGMHRCHLESRGTVRDKVVLAGLV